MNALAVSFATKQNEDWLIKNNGNPYILARFVKQKISLQEYITARQADKRTGYLRLNDFWSFFPLIYISAVEEEHQRRGAGRAILEFLEAYVNEKNHPFILSPSSADEAEPQAWHRRRGFKDAGALTNYRPLQTISDLIFIKHLS